MEFKLKANTTEKWFRITDWYDEGTVLEAKLAAKDAEVSFEIKSSKSDDTVGFVKLDIAKNARGSPGTWGTHNEDIVPKNDATYDINDDHLPA